MGKASRKKYQQRLQQATVQKYGKVKLSEAILHLCEPFDTDALDFDGHHRLITLAVTAWNIALSTDLEERKSTLLSALDKLPGFHQEFERDMEMMPTMPTLNQDPPDSVVMLHILAELIKRKDELYPNDERHILDFSFKPTPKGVHLQIKSLIPKRADE
ncbi:MAG: hypothetical protein PHH59_15640 [Methylovulum sp.]|uniref:hypothetical protein n=1 Tax=Methylovulum sp. TaxID=1916980 RepID=UPI00262E38D3|nr:hypothetical protein [Methylovulum sp.]MDD2725438.1 hypothetical protein [Methylovulum sp.]MDD5124475.1 hypothetical protein [Methylovulum sp.]